MYKRQDDYCEKYGKNDEAVDIYKESIAEVRSSQMILVARIKREALEASNKIARINTEKPYIKELSSFGNL